MNDDKISIFRIDNGYLISYPNGGKETVTHPILPQLHQEVESTGTIYMPGPREAGMAVSDLLERLHQRRMRAANATPPASPDA